ncbi:GNAT family N-acetyltransferase [Basilea psittacipulmonis]|uniref:L-ornithine N(alpha)-acyltransferase n=1 Tax=Basilea psittacipulmonis DSM 24701 TaxID=1072685 RepID=A0A077DFK4_9BURK|nr:GNAT family N-acyltransferase [Basilea psittacipulmonis]AIL32951.1 hypothetical protein IX83_06160 [Basilea psittacipulmonis DSM 24701]
MKEIFRVDDADTQLILGIADTEQEIEQIQRLRYEVYTQDMGVHFPEAEDGVDKDSYDPYCQHLMVVDAKKNKIVGTYRVMLPEQAKIRGYYTESEFDISKLLPNRDILCECGRSCTHPDYRSGGTIRLLWMGLAYFLRTYKCRYILGCASTSLSDGGLQAAQVWYKVRDVAKAENLMIPLHPYPIDELEKLIDPNSDIKISPLIKGYLSMGGSVCGYPAWDKDFNAVDFPILVDVERMTARYRHHFGL